MGILGLLGIIVVVLLLYVGGGLLGWIIEAISKILGFISSGWSHGCGGCLGCLWVIFIILLILAGLCL